MDATTTRGVILDLLRGAAAAHGAYEADELGGVYDEAWPEWYAAHMSEALAAQGYRLTGLATTTDAVGSEVPVS